METAKINEPDEPDEDQAELDLDIAKMCHVGDQLVKRQAESLRDSRSEHRYCADSDLHIKSVKCCLFCAKMLQFLRGSS